MTHSPSPRPYVEVRNLRHHFDLASGLTTRLLGGEPPRRLMAVNDVSFSIPKGETFALVGESGSGKTTIARILAGLLAPVSGEIRIDNWSMVAGQARPGAVRNAIQMIFQDPYASVNPRWRVGRIIAEPIRDLPAAERDRRVAELLELVGLHPGDADRFPHQFSGGQRQRIAIARSLSADAPFVVCDEPTSALDVSVQAQILNLIRELQASRALTYLFISHNLAVVRYMADRIGVLYLGRLVEVAPAAELFVRPRHPYTRMLLNAVPGQNRARSEIPGDMPSPLSLPEGCAFHPRCPFARDLCRRERPELRNGAACHFADELSPPATTLA